MIILSVGMPRAGSGWHYNLIHDLVIASGGEDARKIRQQYHLQSILTEVNCNIGILSLRRLSTVIIPSLLGKTFAIKAHSGPTLWSRALERIGQMRITYIYRDPRDAMLSAYDYGQRALQQGQPNAFSPLINFETSLDFIMDYVYIWEGWIQQKSVLHARYEDLLINYDVEAARLLGFLRLEGQDKAIQAVIEKYRPEQTSTTQKGLHYFMGKIGRFRGKWTPRQQGILAQKLGAYLERMGYEV